MSVVHFKFAGAFRQWLLRHHATARELVVGLHTKQSGRGGPTYAEALDEALCFGWIDGVRGKVDADTYSIRFTPRRPGSIWSNVNVRHVARLRAAGRMHATGLAAFARRNHAKTGIYSFEQRPKRLPPSTEKTFRAHARAWKFFSTQAPWYQRLAIYKIVSPKQAVTRERWLARIIAASAAGRRFQ